jgi:hypothetical protein
LPILKNDIRNNTTIRLNGIRPYEQEQRIANAILQDRIEFKDTSLSRMTGLKTLVTYYLQKAIGANNYLVNTDTLGTTDLNNRLFIKIKELVITCMGEMAAQVDQKEMGVDLIADGQVKILPKTIQPMIGDYFIMTVYNKPCLFKVTNVNKTTLEDDSAYEATYQLIEENPDEKLKQIEGLVSDTYQFVYSHVGTSFRTLFKSDEFKALESMDKIYRRIGSIYNELFYDKDKNTYILTYDTLDRKDEKPYVIAEASLYGEPVPPPSLNLSDSWFNSKMYDRMLVEFITRNHLFDYVDKRIFKVSQLRPDIEKWYSRTIYYALENQECSRIVFKYMLPSPITRVTIATSLNLFGVVSLEPMAEKLLSSLDLYPPPLLHYILWEGKEKSVEEYALNKNEELMEFICETIGLYVNRKEESILKRILAITGYMDSLFELSIQNHHLFYVLPLLSFVIYKAMNRLSDSEFSLNNV